MSYEHLRQAVAKVMGEAERVSLEKENYLPTEVKQQILNVADNSKGFRQDILRYVADHSLIPISEIVTVAHDGSYKKNKVKNRVKAVNEMLRDTGIDLMLQKISRRNYYAVVPVDVTLIDVETDGEVLQLPENLEWLLNLLRLYTVKNKQTGEVFPQIFIPILEQIAADPELRTKVDADTFDQSRFVTLTRVFSKLLFDDPERLADFFMFYFREGYAGIETVILPDADVDAAFDRFVDSPDNIDEEYVDRLQNTKNLPGTIKNMFFGRFASKYLFTNSEREFLFELVQANEREMSDETYLQGRFYKLDDDEEGAFRVRLVGIRQKLDGYSSQLVRHGYEVSVENDHRHGYRLAIKEVDPN